MTKKTLISAVVFVFLLVSSVWAIPPNNAALQNYMKHRYVFFYLSGQNWTVDMRHVISYHYKEGSSFTETIQLSNGSSISFPARTPGRSQIDSGLSFTNVGHAWVEFFKIVAANPQLSSIP